ncbi:MAG TPA: alpha/beta hydrolase [Aestuariivirga sp.]|nr:alpha/beta hydrolase [Aestuariivirga sp.]
MSLIKFFAVFAIVAYAAVALGMYVFQRKLQYHAENKSLTPEGVGLLGASVETLTTADGEKIILWHAPAKAGMPTILYFQGNAGEIGDRPLRFNYYHSRGFGVAYLSYRGFGGSSGSPSEAGLMADATAAYDWLMAKGVEPNRIALLGESLGSGVAVQLAAKREVGALALEAPYTSTVEVAAKIYWWLPVHALMKDQFKSIDFIAAVVAPLLIIHGDQDGIIPVEFGRRLFAAANQPKELEIVQGFGHDVLFEETTWAREAEFFARVIK